MLSMIDTYLENASNEFDITMVKVNSFLEAVDRQFEINCKEAEIKVLKESGTEDDLQFLIEAAEDGVLGNIVKAIEKIKEAIVKFFSEIKSKIISWFNNAETDETLDKLEKKVKLNPILAHKKVTIENEEKIDKAYDKAISKLSKIKAKIKSGQNVSDDEITDVKDEFNKDLAVAIGVGAAVTITLAAAIALVASKKKKVSNDLKKVEEETVKPLDELAKQCEASGDDKMARLYRSLASTKMARLYRSLASTYADVGKSTTNAKVRVVPNAIAAIKRALGKGGNAVADAGKAVAKKAVIAKSNLKHGKLDTDSVIDAVAVGEATDDGSNVSDADIKKMAEEENKEYEADNKASGNVNESEEDPIDDVNPEVVDDVKNAEDPWDAVMQSLEDLEIDADDLEDDIDECGMNCSAEKCSKEGCTKEDVDPEMEALEKAYDALFGSDTEPVQEGTDGCGHENCIGDCIDTKGLSDSKENNEALVSDAFKALKAKIAGEEVDTTSEHDKLQESVSVYDKIMAKINK